MKTYDQSSELLLEGPAYSLLLPEDEALLRAIERELEDREFLELEPLFSATIYHNWSQK